MLQILPGVRLFRLIWYHRVCFCVISKYLRWLVQYNVDFEFTAFRRTWSAAAFFQIRPNSTQAITHSNPVRLP